MAVVADDDHEQQVKQPERKKPESEEDKRRRKIVPESLMKAVVRPGGGEPRPGEGNQFKMKPEMHYGEKDCPVAAPDNFPKDSELHFEIELIKFSRVKISTRFPQVVRKLFCQTFEFLLPRSYRNFGSFLYGRRISAKSGDGKVILSRTQDEPYIFTFGKSEVPKGLELGISTMPRGEKAVVYVKSQYYTESTLMPVVEGVDEVHFEVELVHFIQVRDVLGDGRLIKRRIHDGRGEFPMDCPHADSLLCVHYKGLLLNDEKTVFYDTRPDNNGQPLEFSSGEGLVPQGFEMSVRLMFPGEVSLVTCPPDYDYDKFETLGGQLMFLKDDLDNLDDDEERTRQTTTPPPPPGILSQLRKLFVSVGLNQCTIL